MDQDLFYVSQKEAVSLPKENKQAQKLLLQAYIAFCFILENSTLGILCLKRMLEYHLHVACVPLPIT